MASALPAISASAAALPVSPRPDGAVGAAPLAAAAASPAAAPRASPVSLLEPSTGLVVLEFYDAKGDETASLPTKKQLDLYRLNETSPDIFQPSIRDDTAPSVARHA